MGCNVGLYCSIFQLVEVELLPRRVVILAYLMPLSAFLSLAELGVDLRLEEANPLSCLRVLVICANACGARLAGYVHFLISIVKYYKRMEDPSSFS